MQETEGARQAAIEVLRFNFQEQPFGLPRTAAWGYPEPYTRDLMLSTFGLLSQPENEFQPGVRSILEALAENQAARGQISSLAHDPTDLGSSDATPLFLIGLGLFNRQNGSAILPEAAERAFHWLATQQQGRTALIGQLPTSDWRDEQWVLGHGLYVNSLYYIALGLFGRDQEAERLRHDFVEFDLRPDCEMCGPDGMSGPYYALWAYKVYQNQRFDLLGNSLAILSGLYSRERAARVIEWFEAECEKMRLRGELGVELPPNLAPFIQHGDADWYPRLERFNPPGAYHNGGIWPFVCGFYIAALLQAGFPDLAVKYLDRLTGMVGQSQRGSVGFGFNEWHQAQTGQPQGQDWQTWSAALYLYALACVEAGQALFFDRDFPFAE